jgi:capsid portal protein
VFQPERTSLAWVINNKLLNCYRFQYVEAYFLAPDISNPDDMYKLLNVTNNAGGITPNMAKEVICDALGRTCEPYTDEWGDVPLTIWKDKAAQTDISGLMGQLTKQIEKAQGKNEPDQVVAVMKEVKKLLVKIQKQEENHAA